jgi:hypothetical protein
MKINIPDKYADLYLKALNDRKIVLLDKIREFEKEIKEIDHHMSMLTSMPIFKEDTFSSPIKWEPKNYKPEWSWTKKIDHYFLEARILSTARDILGFIADHEPDVEKSKVRSSISAALSNNVKKGVCRKYQDPVTQNSYYGLPAWFDKKNQPKLEFIPPDMRNRLAG